MKNPAAFRGVFPCYLSRDEIRPNCGQLHEAYACFFSSTFSSSPLRACLKLRMPSPRPFATSGIFLPPNSSTAIPRMTRSSMGPIDLIRTPYTAIVGVCVDARQAALYWVQAANAAVVFRSGAEGQLSHNYSRAPDGLIRRRPARQNARAHDWDLCSRHTW